MAIAIKRAYQAPAPADGRRFLVDRLWPRGLSREQLQLDGWLRELAPSTRLRQAFHHEKLDWEEFCQQYQAELEDQPEQLRQLVQLARQGPLTLVYAARDTTRNHAVVLRDYLRQLDPE